MAFLSKEGYKTISVADLINWLKKDGQLPERSVMITFDDGYQDNFYNAFPILTKYGHRAVFFPIINFIGTDKTIPEYNNTQYGKIMDWAMINEMSSAGMEFGSHTISHPILTETDDTQLLSELKDSKEILEEHLQRKIHSFCYPKGLFDGRSISLLKKLGYELAFTTLVGTNFKNTDTYLLRRTEIKPDDTVYDFKKRLEGGYDILVKFDIWLTKRRVNK